MENFPTTAAQASGNSGYGWTPVSPPFSLRIYLGVKLTMCSYPYQRQPDLPSMHRPHQRTTSNPRPYAAPDPPPAAPESRRDEPSPIYPSAEGYPYQQSSGYTPMSNVGYGYATESMGISSYGSTASPTAASGSRRTSGPKPASTPPAPSPSTGANPSPSSRYYSHQQAGEGSSSHHFTPQSPYQPTSAPPQAVSHHHTSMPNQAQTAHPYGGGYYNYYDPIQTHQPQWSHHPPTAHGPNAAPPRTHQSSSASTLAASGPANSEQHRTTASSSSTTYEYPSSAPYQGWSQDPSRMGSYSSTSASRSNHGQVAPTTTNQQAAWQGYPSHHMQPPYTMPGQGQYGWQHWNPQYAYPPAPAHQLHSASAPNTMFPGTMANVKKSKKDKKGELDDYSGLGKRPAEFAFADDETKKKGKKEEEKPVAKPPAKSHLHPPRQAQSAWQLFFTDELNKAKASASHELSPGGTPQHAKLNVAQIAKDAGAAYASLNDEQREQYSQKVQESREQYVRDLAVWQSTLTPEDIRAENAFRAQQRKEGKSRKGNLKDPNAPKKPLSAYFLFLKGIREDDGLRSTVWGEETETTKQSVLAAERWRGLSVEEKKPYLQQAERDKQQYELARKQYEEDAAARARGEDVPSRPLYIPNVKAEEPNFGEFTYATPDINEAELANRSMDDEFNEFQNPLEATEMNLSAFPGVAASGGVDHEGQWDDLQNLIGNPAEEPRSGLKGNDSQDVKGGFPTSAVETVMGTEDISVAPTMAEAVEETAEDISPSGVPEAGNEGDVREIAFSAEGSLVIPPEFEHLPAEPETPHIPTEEVNELPPADMPIVVGELPTSTIDQVEAEADQPEAEAGAPGVEGTESGQPAVEGDDGTDGMLNLPGTTVDADRLLEPEIPAIRHPTDPQFVETSNPEIVGAPSPQTVSHNDRLTTDPAAAFETAALTGFMVPEAVNEQEISLAAPASSTLQTEAPAHGSATEPIPIDEVVTAAPATINGNDEEAH